MRQIPGEAVVNYCEPLTTWEMAYHRLSQRVNKMKIKPIFYDSPICMCINTSGFESTFSVEMLNYI
jgi:hypothetical protein